MQSINIDIALALILVIPFHGIFLSIFFFINSGWKVSPNFFLGLLLLVLSSLILFQLTDLHYKCIAFNNARHFSLYELLISPFLFLYNLIMIKPVLPGRIYLHLLIAIFNFLLFVLTESVSSPIFIVLAVVFIIINGLYLAGSVRLLIDLVKNPEFSWEYLQASECHGIIIINILICSTIIISIIFYLICPVNNIHLTQVLKALVIYYIYFRILNRADFPN